MSPRRNPTRLLVLVAALLAAAALMTAPGAGPFAVADNSGGVGVDVDVISSSPTPTGAPSASPTSGDVGGTDDNTKGDTDHGNPGSGTGDDGGSGAAAPGDDGTGGGGSGTGDGGGSGGGGGDNAPNGDEEQSIAGMIYVSGLTWFYTPSMNPFDGSLTVRYTIRNAYRATLDISSRVWVTNVLGWQVGTPATIAVAGLAPGESRVVETPIAGMAQWTFLTAHTTVTPPDSIDGIALTPLTRDAAAWFVPWFLIVIFAAVIAAFAIRHWRRHRETGISEEAPQ